MRERKSKKRDVCRETNWNFCPSAASFGGRPLMSPGQKAFLAFVIIGGFASLVNLGSRIVINLVTNFEVSIVLAFGCGVTTAFVLNRIFVFRDAGADWHGQLFRFVLVNLATLVQIFLITEAFALWIFPAAGMNFYPKTVAHAIGLLSPLLTSYWAHKYFTFRPATTGEAFRKAQG
jgi:putative flippase GtrA